MIIRKIDLPNVWYHGTTSDHLISLLNGIKLDICNDNTDFGKGFYTTSNYEQAYSFAKLQTKKYNALKLKHILKYKNGEFYPSHPLIIKYGIDLNALFKLKGMVFNKPDDKWKEFVYNNRRGILEVISDFHNLNCSYSFVYGSVADSLEKISKGEDYKCVKSQYEDQLSLHTENAIKCLKRLDYKIHWSDRYEKQFATK